MEETPTPNAPRLLLLPKRPWCVYRGEPPYGSKRVARIQYYTGSQTDTRGVEWKNCDQVVKQEPYDTRRRGHRDKAAGQKILEYLGIVLYIFDILVI